MLALTAWWGMGYAALMVATIAYGLHNIRGSRAFRWAGHTVAAASTLLLWLGLSVRATKGHGWPLTTPADTATGIALLMLPVALTWESLSRGRGPGFVASAVALLLLSFGLGQQAPSFAAQPMVSTAAAAVSALDLLGGSLLALAAAVSLTDLMRSQYALCSPGQRSAVLGIDGRGSEALVRGALFCLAASLAIDTWWLQKIGLGGGDDAQQAGIAVAWMVYFVALRLRSNSRWRGWPWTAILTVGFVCTLPILINAPWLDVTLPI